MKKKLLICCLFLTLGASAQLDSIQNARYEVINSYFEKGNRKLDKRLFQFRGIQFLLEYPESFESTLGYCVDLEKKEDISLSKALPKNIVDKMINQIWAFSYIRELDQKRLRKNITLIDNPKQIVPSITLPLVYQNKAVFYFNNKVDNERLVILEKINGKWQTKCNFHLYLRLH